MTYAHGVESTTAAPIEELDDFVAPIIAPDPAPPGPGGLIGKLIRWFILH